MADPCPSLDCLEDWVSGQAVDAELSTHVTACPQCAVEVDRIRADNQLLQHLATIDHRTTLSQASPSDSLAPSDAGGTSIDAYRIVRELHHGGQGVVYEAMHEASKRRVALKMPLLGKRLSVAAKRRFERETELVASLRHPNIVTLYDSGPGAPGSDGRPFLVMEFVDGLPIDRFVRENLLRAPETISPKPGELQAAMRLFLDVCGAVQHAHQRGVIHRDLKPGNVFVDTEGRVRVLDFGLAKALDPVADGQPVTRTAEFVGTLSYAAPEQVSGDPQQIDTRTDVYSLGVLLYELLTGRLPYTCAGSLSDVVRTITTVEPHPPRSICAWMDDELETIVLKALSKDRERRYRSVGALSDDVQRYLAGDAIDAKRDSTWYVLRKSARRHRAAIAAGTVLALFLLAFSIMMTFQARRVARERDRADENAVVLAQALHESIVERGAMAARTGNTSLAETLLWNDWLSPTGMDRDKEIATAINEPSDTLWALCELYLRQPCRATWQAHVGDVAATRFSSDGNTLFTAGKDGLVREWSIPSGRLLRPLFQVSSPIVSGAFSADGRYFVAAVDGALQVLDASDGKLLASLDGNGADISQAWPSPNGERIAYLKLPAGSIALWDWQTGPPAQELVVDSIYQAAWNPDGSLWAASSERPGRVSVFEATKTALVRLVQLDTIEARGLAFSPDGHTLAMGESSRIWIWDVATWQRRDMKEFAWDTVVNPVAFTPDGDEIICAGADRVIRRVSVEGLEQTASFGSHVGVIDRLAVDPTGRYVAAGVAGGSIRLWDLQPEVRTILPQGDTVHCARYSPDGRLLVVTGGSSAGSFARVLDAKTGAIIHELVGHTDTVAGAAFSGDSARVATASYDSTVRLWDVASGMCLKTFGERLERGYASVAMDAPGNILVASGNYTPKVHMWNVATGYLREFDEQYGRVPSLALSPDGALMAFADLKGTVFIRDVLTGSLLHTLRDHTVPVRAVAFSPDGRLLATGGDDSTIRFWNPVTGECTGVIGGLPANVFSLSFDPTGRILASGGREKSVRLWDVAARRQLAELPGHLISVFSVSFHPDGRSLASGGPDHTLALWNLDALDQYIAGNLKYQISRVGESAIDPQRLTALRDWARAVSSRHGAAGS